MEMRELKALEIAARQRIVSEGNGVYTVPSQTSAAKYRVVLHPVVSCTCEDWLLRQGECKHILAAKIARERIGGEKEQQIETNEVPKRPTYRQNWPVYNLAQREEKRRFQVLLHDLCAGLPEPDRDGIRGRRPHTVADKVFAVCFKVYTTLSSRRFGSDLVDAHERGYLSASLCVNKVNIILESPDVTPHLYTLITRSGIPLRGRNRVRHGPQRVQRVQVRPLVRLCSVIRENGKLAKIDNHPFSLSRHFSELRSKADSWFFSLYNVGRRPSGKRRI